MKLHYYKRIEDKGALPAANYSIIREGSDAAGETTRIVPKVTIPTNTVVCESSLDMLLDPSVERVVCEDVAISVFDKSAEGADQNAEEAIVLQHLAYCFSARTQAEFIRRMLKCEETKLILVRALTRTAKYNPNSAKEKLSAELKIAAKLEKELLAELKEFKTGEFDPFKEFDVEDPAQNAKLKEWLRNHFEIGTDIDPYQYATPNRDKNANGEPRNICETDNPELKEWFESTLDLNNEDLESTKDVEPNPGKGNDYRHLEVGTTVLNTEAVYGDYTFETITLSEEELTLLVKFIEDNAYSIIGEDELRPILNEEDDFGGDWAPLRAVRDRIHASMEAIKERHQQKSLEPVTRFVPRSECASAKDAANLQEDTSDSKKKKKKQDSLAGVIEHQLRSGVETADEILTMLLRSKQRIASVARDYHVRIMDEFNNPGNEQKIQFNIYVAPLDRRIDSYQEYRFFADPDGNLILGSSDEWPVRRAEVNGLNRWLPSDHLFTQAVRRSVLSAFNANKQNILPNNGAMPIIKGHLMASDSTMHPTRPMDLIMEVVGSYCTSSVDIDYCIKIDTRKLFDNTYVDQRVRPIELNSGLHPLVHYGHFELEAPYVHKIIANRLYQAAFNALETNFLWAGNGKERHRVDANPENTANHIKGIIFAYMGTSLDRKSTIADTKLFAADEIRELQETPAEELPLRISERSFLHAYVATMIEQEEAPAEAAAATAEGAAAVATAVVSAERPARTRATTPEDVARFLPGFYVYAQQVNDSMAMARTKARATVEELPASAKAAAAATATSPGR